MDESIDPNSTGRKFQKYIRSVFANNNDDCLLLKEYPDKQTAIPRLQLPRTTKNISLDILLAGLYVSKTNIFSKIRFRTPSLITLQSKEKEISKKHAYTDA